MGKFSQVKPLREVWGAEELNSLDAAREVVIEVEKHKSLVMSTIKNVKMHSRKLQDLKIRRDISKDHSLTDDVFPAIVNSHVRESLRREICERSSTLMEIVENLSKSLKSVQIATQNLDVGLQMIPLRENESSHEFQELRRVLSYTLDASLSIFAYYMKFQTHFELIMEERENLEASLANFEERQEDAKDFARFINEFLCQCRMEPIFRWEKDADE